MMDWVVLQPIQRLFIQNFELVLGVLVGGLLSIVASVVGAVSTTQFEAIRRKNELCRGFRRELMKTGLIVEPIFAIRAVIEYEPDDASANSLIEHLSSENLDQLPESHLKRIYNYDRYHQTLAKVERKNSERSEIDENLFLLSTNETSAIILFIVEEYLIHYNDNRLKDFDIYYQQHQENVGIFGKYTILGIDHYYRRLSNLVVELESAINQPMNFSSNELNDREQLIIYLAQLIIQDEYLQYSILRHHRDNLINILDPRWSKRAYFRINSMYHDTVGRSIHVVRKRVDF